jgi:ATP synthase protein I
MTPPSATRDIADRWRHDGPEVDPWSALSLIISGVLLWGAIGWGVSRWLNSTVYMGAGVVIGGVLGVLTVYLRYGRAQSGPPVTGGPVVFPGQAEVTQGAVTPGSLASSAVPTPSVPPTVQEVTP